MALYNHNVNNLSGGVSQQPVANRFDNQVESMENCLITSARGLRRRGPLNYGFQLPSTIGDNLVIHSYDRGDGLEKYGMILSDDGLRVYEPDGTERTVNIVGVNPMTAFAGSDYAKDVRFLTAGDTTWILNRSSATTMSPTLTPNDASSNTAFYWLKKSFNDGTSGVNHGYAYTISLTDLGQVSYNHTDSIVAATNLASLINGNNGYTARSEASLVYITRATPFEIWSGDSWGNQASIAWQSSISKISDLPASMEGFTADEVGTIAVTGTDKDTFTSYYLEWTGTNWAETVAEGVEYLIDSTTMPAKLVRQADGTFSFGFNVIDEAHDGFTDTWGERKKGDDNSNPIPSFIGHPIGNMFFFKNRLGLTSGENVIMSETAAYYNFFATTVMEVLDNDPIDAGIDSNTVSVIRNVNATAGALTLWADNAQFVLSGGEILSPATTRISQTSSYACTNTIPPVVVDNEIIFFQKKEGGLNALSYSSATVQADKSSAESISAHVPTYIPDTISQVVVSSTHNLVILLNDANPTELYVYKYMIQGTEKIISAWSLWTFESSIKTINVLDDILYLIDSTNELCTIELEPLEVTDQFLDKGISPYMSRVIMSAFNRQTSQKSQVIREPFYMKTMTVITEGTVDLVIRNSERNNEKIINNKHINRRHLIGGNSEKINVGFQSNYSVGFEIDTINIEGMLKYTSRNV